MKCSQTDCFSSEKEKRNLNHREKWFLGKKKRDWKMITWKQQNFIQKKSKYRTEVLQIWLKDGKIYFSFPFVCLSTFLLPEKTDLLSWEYDSPPCSDRNDLPCTLWSFSSWLSVWVLKPMSLLASKFSSRLTKPYHTSYDKESNTDICKENLTIPSLVSPAGCQSWVDAPSRISLHT